MLVAPAWAGASLGVHVRPAAPGHWIERLGDVGAGHFRANLRWRAVQPGSPRQRYDWSEPDRLARLAAINGISWLPVIIGAPDWAAPVSAWPPRERWYRRYALFVARAADRYGPNGLFWLLRPRLPYRPVTAWEIHNEPNLKSFWRGDPRPGEYAELVALLAPAIHAAAPGTRTLLAGMPIKRPEHFAYVRRAMRIERLRRNIDVTTSHPYAETAPEAVRLAAKVRRLAPRKPHWVTEVGWATAGEHPYLAVSPAAQALRLRGVVAGLRDRGIGDITWFSGWNLRRCGRYDQPHWCGNAGLRYADDRRKPSWSVFVDQLRRQRSRAGATFLPALPLTPRGPAERGAREEEEPDLERGDGEHHRQHQDPLERG